MKKLMIALAAVATGVAAHAATSAWSCEWATDLDFNDVNEGQYWLLPVAAMGGADSWGVYEDGTVSFGDATPYDSGSILDAFSIVGSIDPATAADNGSIYALVLWNGLDKEHGGLFGIGYGEIAGVVDEPPTMGNMFLYNGEDDVSTYLQLNNEVWVKSSPEPTPTPEPTSGLLMLVGLAGLALKRKVA